MKNQPSKIRSRISFLLTLVFVFSFAAFGQQDDDDEDYISPVRPSVSDSATIQKKGVLQIEAGGDFDFHSPEFRSAQDAPLAVYFAATTRLRLDFEFESVASEKDWRRNRETGIGDVTLGFKALARAKPKERLAVAFAYSIKLPTADEERELGTGKVDHDLRLILNRTFGKNNFVFNAAYLNVGRDDSDRRDSGAQAVFTFERELPKKFGIIAETFGNSVDAEQARGLYLLGALTYKVNKRLVFDFGARPGFGHDAPKFNLFFGLTVGAANLCRRK